MSVELLEKAFEKSVKKEREEKRKMKIALALGQFAGIAVAFVLDATLIWAIVNFMIGASVTWVASLGVVILGHLIFIKFRK